MSDEPMFEGFGIPLPLPPELAEAVKRKNDQINMAADAMVARLDAFITSLDVDGLLAMRTILNTGDMPKSMTAQFWDGQLVAILRYVKHVDPDSGRDPLASE